jgi:hypothetical protein
VTLHSFRSLLSFHFVPSFLSLSLHLLLPFSFIHEYDFWFGVVVNWGGTWCQSGRQHWPPRLRFSWFSWVSPGKYRIVSQLRNDHCLTKHLQFIVPQSSSHLTPYSMSY